MMPRLATLVVFATLAAVVAADVVKQVKLAYIPHGMTVSWYTYDYNCGIPEVFFSTDPAGPFMNQQGAKHTYGTGTFWDVPVRNLKDDTVYTYYIGCGIYTTPTRTFRTARLAGDARPFAVAMIGDLGIENAPNTVAALSEAPVFDNTAFNLLIGDLSYADLYYERPKASSYEETWDEWQEMLDPLTSIKPFMVLPGNHEASCSLPEPTSCPPQQQNFTAYRHRFRMPSDESGAKGVQNMWYSFDYGLAHFVQIDTDTDFPNAYQHKYGFGGFGNQLAWLEADLSKAHANRARVPWIIVNGHRPFYSSETYSPCQECRAAFEGLFDKYKVDMYFAGHAHYYERMWAIHRDGTPEKTYLNPRAPTHIINGAGGQLEGLTPMPEVIKDTTAKIYNEDWGYGVLSFVNSTNAHWEYFRASDRVKVDEISLYRYRG